MKTANRAIKSVNNLKKPSPTATAIGAVITIIINTALLIWVVKQY